MKSRTSFALAALFTSACASSPSPQPGAVPAPVVGPVGGVDLGILDRSVSPCDDFYRFACGGWLKTAQIPADQPMWDRGFASLSERNELQLKAILEADAAGKTDPRDAYADKVGAYYAACMDEAAIEKNGPAALHAELAKLDEVKTTQALAAAVGRLQAAGVGALFGFASEQDAKDATLVIGGLGQGGLGLPDRDFYFRSDPKSQKILAAYEQHVGKMLTLASVADAAKKAKRVVALEKKIAATHWTNVELRDPKRTYNRIELGGLEKLAPRFPWNTFFTALGRNDFTAISVSTPKNVEAIGKLVTEVPMEDWRAYLAWHFLDDHKSALPKAFVDEGFRFRSENLTGQKELPARWKRCTRATDSALGEALGQSYVRQHFGATAKTETTRLVAELEAAFGKRLDQLAWMDAPTRNKAREKLGKIFNKVGYPDVFRKYDTLQVSRDSYLENQLAAAACENRRDLAKIGKPVDRTEWGMTPPTVNAYYNPQLNEMVFPAGVLQPPFFNQTVAPALNYGALGMVVGHELTHGFDDEGRQFDGDGNLKEWWSEGVGKEFEQRAQCLVKQYSGYVAVDDVHLNGELTLGENIADLGGLKNAYAAYEAARAGKPPLPPAQGFDERQQFFLGHAQAWCTKMSDEFARTLAHSDPHSPARYRVNGPVSNLPEFAAAFQCKEGSPMAKPSADRCEVW